MVRPNNSRKSWRDIRRKVRSCRRRSAHGRRHRHCCCGCGCCYIGVVSGRGPPARFGRSCMGRSARGLTAETRRRSRIRSWQFHRRGYGEAGGGQSGTAVSGGEKRGGREAPRNTCRNGAAGGSAGSQLGRGEPYLSLQAGVHVTVLSVTFTPACPQRADMGRVLCGSVCISATSSSVETASFSVAFDQLP